MPDTSPFVNTVPLGQAGTGAAFLLPQSTALNNLIGTIQYNSQIPAKQQAAKSAQAAALAKQYKLNGLKAKNGMLWNPELQKLDADHIAQGLKYYQQGFDPFSPDAQNPDQLAASQQYQTDRARLLALHDARASFEKEWLAQDNKIKSDPEGTYDPESVKAFHDFTQMPLQQIVDGNVQIPQVAKNFDEAAMLNKIHPTAITQKVVDRAGNEKEDTVPNMEQIRKDVATNYATNPQAAHAFQRSTGVPITQVPPTGDKAQLTKLITDIYKSPDGIDDLKKDPTIQAMANAGQNVYDSDYFKNLVQAQVEQKSQQFQKANTFLDDKARSVASRVDEKHAKGYNFEWSNHQLRLSEDARARVKFGQEQEDRNSVASYNLPSLVPSAPGAVGTPSAKNPVTVPLEIDAGDIKGPVVPKEIFNTESGHFSGNTSARNITDAKVRLMPMLTIKGKHGDNKKFLSDDDIAKIQAGTYTVDGAKPTFADVKYRYMVYGTEKKKVPQMEPDEDNPGKEKQAVDGNGNPKMVDSTQPIAFDAVHLSDDKFNKKINYDKAEVKLSTPIQLKIINDRLAQRYPDMSPADRQKVVADFYNARLQKYQTP